MTTASNTPATATPEIKIADLKNTNLVKVRIQNDGWVHKNGSTLRGRVHTGTTTCGKKYFYIQPIGDPHPGASVTSNQVAEVLEVIDFDELWKQDHTFDLEAWDQD